MRETGQPEEVKEDVERSFKLDMEYGLGLGTEEPVLSDMLNARR